MELNSDTVTSRQLGCLGLIAAVIRKLKLIEKIDARVDVDFDKGAIVSCGERVAAMILNGLGFMNSRLYMTPHYFQDKPVSTLLRDGIEAEHLNDDCLARGLDKLAEYGVTKLFSEIAFEVAREQNLLGNTFHLDSTSFTLYGNYDGAIDSPLPTYGFSKANRPDLKQVMLSLTQGGAANLPLWMEAQDGNTSDKKSFHETVRRVQQFMKQIKGAPDNLFFVVDAAFYAEEKLKELDKVKWITRVPATLTLSRLWLQTCSDELDWKKEDADNQIVSKVVEQNGLVQRWVMIRSQAAFDREQKTLRRRMQNAYDDLNKRLWHLSNEIFGCADDAKQALRDATKKEKYHHVEYDIVAVEKHTKKGRPKAGAEKIIKGYRIDYRLTSDLEKIERYQRRLGRFILATNELEAEKLSDLEVLKQYKEQTHVERGFKFIKDDMFELDSFFLSTPRRIGALMMVMTLCLMVYNFAQYHIRDCLNSANDILPNQHGKPTQKPTMRWIAEMMVVIAVVTIKREKRQQHIVTNINQVHRKIIGYFGEEAMQIYGLPPDYKQTPIHYHKYKNFLDWCEM